jgi:hypothetical protein
MDFCIQRSESRDLAREKIAIYSSAASLGSKYITSVNCQEGYVPIGTVEYCEQILPKSEVPCDFFPEFLNDWLHRKIGLSTFGCIEQIGTSIKRHELFLKPAKVWKSDFKSRIVGPEENIPYGLYYFSEPVQFVQEWRYYVANGELVTTGWYDGHDEDEPAPKLDIQFPKDFNSAVDFGRLKDGRIALVEAHAPFACGWYGESHVDYVHWQLESWKGYIQNSDAFRVTSLTRFKGA